MTQHLGFTGYSPSVAVKSGNPEVFKYSKLWAEFPQYRAVSPGEEVAAIFVAQARPKDSSEVIDFGCGSGRGALAVSMLTGCQVHMLDFAGNCLDDEIKQAVENKTRKLTFRKHDLTQPCPITAKYGFCADVMEHIPTSDVDKILQNILLAAQHVFFQISCVEDNLGSLIGQDLHLTVKPYSWWLEKLQSLDCVVHWSQDFEDSCAFYVSAWQDGHALVNHGVLNTEEEICRKHIKINAAAGWQQVQPHITNDIEVMILGGGPSLNRFEEKIKEMRTAGVKLICLNGTYNWCLEHGLKPSAVVVVDGRPFNARFTHPVIEDCKYLVASQCDPSVLEGLPKDRTYLWHTTAETFAEELKNSYDVYWGIPGGSTVLLRAIPLLRLLGYHKFHLFGCDSCVDETGHHAFPQPENDGMTFDTIVGDKVFKTQPWMASQAHEFMDLIKFMGDEIELEIYGDGLLAHILNTGASLADIKEA